MRASSDSPSVSRRLISEVRRQVEAAGLVPSTILVGVSGGPDSLALVHALSELRGSLGIRVFAAHLDHGLRPGVSEADAEFVREAMGGLRIPLTSEKADVSSFRETHRLSMEDAARQVRYRFLARVSDRIRADAVAVGHTLDDQAETVLMHVLRGSGLTGLRAMAAIGSRSVDGTLLRFSGRCSGSRKSTRLPTARKTACRRDSTSRIYRKT